MNPSPKLTKEDLDSWVEYFKILIEIDDQLKRQATQEVVTKLESS